MYDRAGAVASCAAIYWKKNHRNAICRSEAVFWVCFVGEVFFRFAVLIELLFILGSICLVIFVSFAVGENGFFYVQINV